MTLHCGRDQPLPRWGVSWKIHASHMSLASRGSPTPGLRFRLHLVGPSSAHPADAHMGSQPRGRAGNNKVNRFHGGNKPYDFAREYSSLLEHIFEVCTPGPSCSATGRVPVHANSKHNANQRNVEQFYGHFFMIRKLGRTLRPRNRDATRHPWAYAAEWQ